MTLDTAACIAAIVLVMLWPLHQQLTIRALRHSLRRQRDQLAQHRRAIIQLQGAAVRPPTSVGQPMPTVGRPAQGGWVNARPWGKENGPELFIPYHGTSAAQVGPGRSSHRRAAPRDERVVSGDRPGSGEPTPPSDAATTLRERFKKQAERRKAEEQAKKAAQEEQEAQRKRQEKLAQLAARFNAR